MKDSEVDEEQSLQVINNADFLKMRCLQKVWPTPMTTEMDLGLLVAQGLLPQKVFSNYELPGEHVVPTPSPDQAILFVHFVRSGLCYPPSDFFLEFLQFYGLQTHHLALNGVLYLSAFAHLCEVFISIPPCLLLFHHFFRLKSADSSTPFGCCHIQSRQGKGFEFFSLSLIDSLTWADKWFYVPKSHSFFSSDLSVPPAKSDTWSLKLSDSEVAAIQLLLDRIRFLRELGLTGNGIVASFIRRQVQPLRQREQLGFEFTGPHDSSRLILGQEMSEEDVKDRLERLIKEVPCMPTRVAEYDSNHPPPPVRVLLFFGLFSFCLVLSLLLSHAGFPFRASGMPSSLILLLPLLPRPVGPILLLLLLPVHGSFPLNLLVLFFMDSRGFLLC